MKTIAVIPARAGSKGIPNKNIRLLNEKPLIFYSIKNALDCSEIDEVIVTTDSVDVQIIATQLGARVHFRSKLLCNDDVTLDEVIFDVTEKYVLCKSSIVITMQPTSPTLKIKTLELALRYYKNNHDIDTLISCVNKPHLCWKQDSSGKKYPDYVKRLNRQYLPPNFIETGAFLITNNEFITPISRLGNNIDIFEVSEDESIDIDNYSDLKNAEFIMLSKKIAFYVNGNNKRGLGHIYRCLELADEFYTKPDIYYDVNQTSRVFFGESTHNFIPVNGIEELFKILT